MPHLIIQCCVLCLKILYIKHNILAGKSDRNFGTLSDGNVVFGHFIFSKDHTKLKEMHRSENLDITVRLIPALINLFGVV